MFLLIFLLKFIK